MQSPRSRRSLQVPKEDRMTEWMDGAAHGGHSGPGERLSWTHWLALRLFNNLFSVNINQNSCSPSCLPWPLGHLSCKDWVSLFWVSHPSHHPPGKTDTQSWNTCVPTAQNRPLLTFSSICSESAFILNKKASHVHALLVSNHQRQTPQWVEPVASQPIDFWTPYTYL